MKTLDDCRVAIDAIDNEMLQLLNKRMKVVERVGEIKKKTQGVPSIDLRGKKLSLSVW